MQYVLAEDTLKKLPLEKVSSLWDSRENNESYILYEGVHLSFIHIKSFLKENGFSFISFYQTSLEEISASKALECSETETLVSLWDDWDGIKLITVNDTIVHEKHLYNEITKRGVKRCLC